MQRGGGYMQYTMMMLLLCVGVEKADGSVKDDFVLVVDDGAYR